MAGNAEQAGIGLKTKKPQCGNTEASGNEINFGEEIVMSDISTQSAKVSYLFKEHVYVIEFGSSLVKVGRSANPERRAAAIASGSGREKSRIWISDPVHAAGPWESRTHAHLGAFRQSGEWFTCSFDDAVIAAKRQSREEEVWTEAGQEQRNYEANEKFELLKALARRDVGQRCDQIATQMRERFLVDMRERAIKNCIAYLSYKEATEKTLWKVISEELSSIKCPASEDFAVAVAVAHSDDRFLSATRIEHVHLGITMESCMLVLNDVDRIPTMLDELEVIARSRMITSEVVA